MNTIKKYILSTLVGTILTCLTLPVFAADGTLSSLSVHPSIISLSLSPGKTSTTTLFIKNNGTAPLPVHLQFEPLTLSDSSVTLQSIGSWVNIENADLLIPAQKEKTVAIKIALPQQIPLGGYYGMLYIQPLSSSRSSVSSLVLTKMGVLILGSVGVQNVPLNLIQLQKPILNTFISETNTLKLSFDVKNTALNHISAKPYLIIHPLFGTPESIQFEQRLVFPGTKRKWDTSFTVKNTHAFYYSADLFVSIGNGLSQKKSFSFVIFPIQEVIILVVFLAVGTSLIRKRRQIKKALGIIIKG